MKRTAALTRLQSRLGDAKRLVEIHEECTGQNRGRRVGYDALNRSAIILAVAAWEGFVEDLLKTAVAQISRHAKGPSALSENVREAMIAYMYETHGWGKLNTTTKETIWALTGRGWRKSYRDYTQVRINSLHTPNYENVKKLYSSTIGLADFTCDWGATRWRPEDYRQKLERLLALRHRIAHGQIGTETVGKTKAKDAASLVVRISGWTDKTARAHVRRIAPIQRRRLVT